MKPWRQCLEKVFSILTVSSVFLCLLARSSEFLQGTYGSEWNTCCGFPLLTGNSIGCIDL